MNIKLDRSLCFFDLESTGLNVVTDRIIQIAIIKYIPGEESPVEMEMLINPGIPISPEAMEITGITAQTVANKPTFQQVANEIYAFIGDSDLAGYNSNRFDVPLLMEEFHRVGIDFSLKGRRLVDVQNIFYKMEPRTLAAALKFYRGKPLENAHDALADVRATVEVLEGQIEKYQAVDYTMKDGSVKEEPVRNDVQSLSDFSTHEGLIDVTQRLKYDSNNNVVFNFGKYKGRPVSEVLKSDKQYYKWIISKEFSIQVKKIIKEIYEKDVMEN